MSILSKKAFNGNVEYNKKAKEEMAMVMQAVYTGNEAFIANIMLGKNKFTVGNQEYEFKALKFNTNKQNTPYMHAYGLNLIDELHALQGTFDFDYEKAKQFILKVGNKEPSVYGLNPDDTVSTKLTEDQLDDLMAEDYPESEESIEQVRQANIEREIKNNNEGIKVRLDMQKNFDTEGIFTLDELKEQMHVIYPSQMDEKETEYYNRYLELRTNSMAQAKLSADDYTQRREEELNRVTEAKRQELENTLQATEQGLNEAVEDGTLGQVFNPNIAGMTYEEYIGEKIDQIFHSRYGNLENINGQKEVLGEAEDYSELRNMYIRDVMENGIDTTIEGINLKGYIKLDMYGFMADIRIRNTERTENEIKEYEDNYNKETKAGVKEIYDNIEANNRISQKYEVGLRIAYDSRFSQTFVDKACEVIKNAQTYYKGMSGVGRFFSYLNPFPNKYREARTNVKNMIDTLSREANVDKKTIQGYVYDGKTATPKMNPNLPKYEEVVEKYVALENNKLRNGEPLYEEVIEEQRVNEPIPEALQIHEMTQEEFEASVYNSVENNNSLNDPKREINEESLKALGFEKTDYRKETEEKGWEKFQDQQEEYEYQEEESGIFDQSLDEEQIKEINEERINDFNKIWNESSKENAKGGQNLNNDNNEPELGNDEAIY